LFRDEETQLVVRASVFGDMAKVVGAAMMTKYTHYNATLWKVAVTSFITLMHHGLSSLSISTMTDIQRTIVWTELIDSIQTFLLHEDQRHRNVSNMLLPEKRAEEEDYDVRLVNAMATEMVFYATKSKSKTQAQLVYERVLEILHEGSGMVGDARERFALSCYRNLFLLAGGHHVDTFLDVNDEDVIGQKDKLANMVIPVLLAKSRDVIQRFVIDDRQSGHCPLPRHRLVEVSFLLRELRTLELPGSSNKRRHLLELYHLFCDCITSSEKELKELLKDIFYQVGNEFLQVDPGSQISSTNSNTGVINK